MQVLTFAGKPLEHFVVSRDMRRYCASYQSASKDYEVGFLNGIW